MKKNSGTNYDVASDMLILYTAAGLLHKYLIKTLICIVSYRKAWVYLYSCDDNWQFKEFFYISFFKPVSRLPVLFYLILY